MIQDFEDFCRELNTCGFSIGGDSAKAFLLGNSWTIIIDGRTAL